jgi:hypothetical protein
MRGEINKVSKKNNPAENFVDKDVVIPTAVLVKCNICIQCFMSKFALQKASFHANICQKHAVTPNILCPTFMKGPAHPVHQKFDSYYNFNL